MTLGSLKDHPIIYSQHLRLRAGRELARLPQVATKGAYSDGRMTGKVTVLVRTCGWEGFSVYISIAFLIPQNFPHLSLLLFKVHHTRFPGKARLPSTETQSPSL
jgi:hypothetical protein